jgi:hypothetical protein
MTFEERNVWLFGATTFASYIFYLAWVLLRSRGIPLAETPYAGPMLWAIGGSIVASILGYIANYIVMYHTHPGEVDKKDIRDREIERFGDYAGQIFMIIGGLAAMILSMLRAPHFWIANAVYLSFVLAALLSTAVKLYAYCRGIPRC